MDIPEIEPVSRFCRIHDSETIGIDVLTDAAKNRNLDNRSVDACLL
jgi:hypothetical protein